VFFLSHNADELIHDAARHACISSEISCEIESPKTSFSVSHLLLSFLTNQRFIAFPAKQQGRKHLKLFFHFSKVKNQFKILEEAAKNRGE
jgi:hypothetical protein